MKTNYIYLITACLLHFIEPKIYAAQNADSVLHVQEVKRITTMYEPLRDFKGELKLTSDSVIFTREEGKQPGSFTLSYDDILSVKRAGYFLILPGKIVIEDKNYAKYRLKTFKRKKIVDIIQSKI
ncbi:MAG: hypothetical protein JJU23_12745 [Cyclobacteriaceae bacterium]|nr:hypothetical protein [Cyclobacteriaceae bacterium]